MSATPDSTTTATLAHDSSWQDADCFRSLAEMRQVHAEMLKLHWETENSPEFVKEVKRFLECGAATGALLDAEGERSAAQSLLDYWANMLFRATAKDRPPARL